MCLTAKRIRLFLQFSLAQNIHEHAVTRGSVEAKWGELMASNCPIVSPFLPAPSSAVETESQTVRRTDNWGTHHTHCSSATIGPWAEDAISFQPLYRWILANELSFCLETNWEIKNRCPDSRTKYFKLIKVILWQLCVCVALHKPQFSHWCKRLPPFHFPWCNRSSGERLPRPSSETIETRRRSILFIPFGSLVVWC